MTISAASLRELHRIHRQLSDLRSRLDRGPKLIRATEANFSRLESEMAGAKEVYTMARVASDDKQLQLKHREDRIADLKFKLNSANTNKEYQALKEQIAADEQANSVLGDEILEALVKIDDLKEVVSQAEASVAKAKAEAEKTRKRVDEERTGLESELGRVQDELKQAEAQLPLDFKAEYLRICQARGEDALAEVEGETCGGCYRILSPQTMNELYMSKPVFCKTCGALMYLPEDRSVGTKSESD